MRRRAIDEPARPGLRPSATAVAALALSLAAACCGGRSVDVAGAAGEGAAAACGGSGDGNTIATFRSPNGTCIPADELLLHRCVASDVPSMIVRGAAEGGGRRFVGGRFAVPLASLPPGARPIGSAGAVQVLAVPGDPTRMFVRTEGRNERWLSLPREPVASPPSAWFIGDSIALGAQPWIEEALPGWVTTFDAQIGRGSAAGVAIAPSAAAALPDVVVVELGTNDASPDELAANAEAILGSLRDVPLVIWQNTHGPEETIPAENNGVIAEAVAGAPNAALADWSGFVDEGVLNGDGVHVQPAHEDEMAKLIVPFLVHWLAAMDLTAPMACDGAAEGS